MRRAGEICEKSRGRRQSGDAEKRTPARQPAFGSGLADEAGLSPLVLPIWRSFS
jgi:hypothetical protein